MNTKEKILDKVKRLLALSDASKNSSDEEAKAALLKAQELMAKYDISAEEVEQEEQEKYSHEMCEHKWDYAYRVPLAQLIGKNFRCMVYMQGKSITFMGHTSDAKICKVTFEYAYNFIMRRGSQIYNKRYSLGQTTKGVFNSYARGFIAGLNDAFDIQCRALVIVTPPDVVDEFKEFTKGFETKRKGMKQDDLNYAVYCEGRKDGKSFMDKDKLPE